MSRTTVIQIWPGERAQCGEELRNSHGSAPIVWNELCKRWLGARDFGWTECIDRLWPLYERRDIPAHQRAVLLMTYDMAYVERAEFTRAAQDIRLFLADFPQKMECVNHWPRIAEIFESEEVAPALGLWCTSVSENPFDGPWDEANECYGPPDWAQTFSVYSELSKWVDGSRVGRPTV